jgi:hypothetical protein
MKDLTIMPEKPYIPFRKNFIWDEGPNNYAGKTVHPV